MNKKLISIFVVVLFMSIGFAAIVINLNIEGESKVAFNEADFNIFFSKVTEGGVNVNYQITTSDCASGTFNGSSCTSTATTPKNVSYSCPSGWTRSGSICSKTETVCDEEGDPTCNAAGTYCYRPCYRSHEDTSTQAASASYSCPSGYTGSGSGSNLTCSKTVTSSLTNSNTNGSTTILSSSSLVHSFTASKPGIITFKSTNSVSDVKCSIKKNGTEVATDIVEVGESSFTCSYQYASGDKLAFYVEGTGSENVINAISEDGNSFTYNSTGANAVKYYAINRSVNYNAVMSVSCNQAATVSQETESLMAGTIVSGTVSSSYVGDVTCTLSALPTAREQQNKNDAIKITLNPRGGTVDVSEFYVLNDYEFGPLPTPKKKEYEFKGWYMVKNGTKTQVTADTIVDLEDDTTLRAEYNVPPLEFYNKGEMSGYPLTSISYNSDKYIYFNQPNITYSNAKNSAIYSTTLINNDYQYLNVHVLYTEKNYSWSELRLGVRPIYGDDGSEYYTQYFMPSDWLALKQPGISDSWQTITIDLSNVKQDYYLYFHTAGTTWEIDHIWFSD